MTLNDLPMLATSLSDLYLPEGAVGVVVQVLDTYGAATRATTGPTGVPVTATVLPFVFEDPADKVAFLANQTDALLQDTLAAIQTKS